MSNGKVGEGIGKVEVIVGVRVSVNGTCVSVTDAMEEGRIVVVPVVIPELHPEKINVKINTHTTGIIYPTGFEFLLDRE
jgi:glutamate synthase domain-containing protein 3